MPDLLHVVFGVWVEMLCYAAHHCSRDSHARQLNNGGEFITIAWLLTSVEFNRFYWREYWFKERKRYKFPWHIFLDFMSAACSPCRIFLEPCRRILRVICLCRLLVPFMCLPDCVCDWECDHLGPCRQLELLCSCWICKEEWEACASTFCECCMGTEEERAISSSILQCLCSCHGGGMGDRRRAAHYTSNNGGTTVEARSRPWQWRSGTSRHRWHHQTISNGVPWYPCQPYKHIEMT